MVDCKNAVFCPSWGERKCTVLHKRIYNPEKTCGESCEHYSAGVNNDPCRCALCQEREANMEDDLK